MTENRSNPGRIPPAWDQLIVDGFSLIHRDPECRNLLIAGRLFPARRCLVERLERLTGAIAGRIHVVFDGQGSGGTGDDFAGSAVDITYSPSGTTADLIIERMVRESPAPRRVLVITSDRMERDSVDAAGARHMGCGDFLEWIRKEEAALSRAARRTSGKGAGLSLGDCFPDGGVRKPGPGP